MDSPRYTVAIPTYRRADRISESLRSVVVQDYPNLEILVVDNGDGTDGTEAVVKAFGDRVIYHRNPVNLGLWGNFARAVELGTGEYFSWLTDDDFFRAGFCTRAAAGLSMSPDLSMYACYAVLTPSPRSVRKHTTIHGPAVAVDWLGGHPTIVDGLAWPALNYFDSQGMPPAVACRREVILATARWLQPNCVQFNENIWMGAIAAKGRVVVDPWVGVMHTEHAQQAHTIVNNDRELLASQLKQYEEFLGNFFPTLPGRWRQATLDAIAEIPPESLWAMLGVPQDPATARLWDAKPPICRELRDLIISGLPETMRDQAKASFAMQPKWWHRYVAARLRRTVLSARWSWSQS